MAVPFLAGLALKDLIVPGIQTLGSIFGLRSQNKSTNAALQFERENELRRRAEWDAMLAEQRRQWDAVQAQREPARRAAQEVMGRWGQRASRPAYVPPPQYARRTIGDVMGR